MNKLLYRILLGVSMILVLPSASAGYSSEDQAKANAILKEAKKGGKFHPVVRVSEADNATGHATVYEGEYGVFVQVDNDAAPLLENLRIVNAHAYEGEEGIQPQMMPHVTLVQGVFNDAAYKKLEEIVATLASETPIIKITMDNKYVKGGGGNTFLDVQRDSQSWEFFNMLNERLTQDAPPSGPMKQVLDDIKEGTADLEQMGDGRAWRDFNIPGGNRPHITAVYSRQGDPLIELATQLLTQALGEGVNPTFWAKSFSIGRIDERGNIFEVVQSFPFKGVS